MFKKIKQTLLNDKTFFRQHENGQYVFYPWGYPGEGVVVDSHKAFKLAIFVTAYPLLVILYGVSIVFADILFNMGDIIYGYLSCSLLMLAVPVYAFLIYMASNQEEMVAGDKNGKYLKKRFLLFMPYSVAQFGLGILHYTDVTLFFLCVYILSFVFTTHLFSKILRTRGHYFSNASK